ncbi:MAG: hypothetical protein QME58_09120 [Bacteroidota bacterium]|nr:hypothetical protein [Bacteroidota bacterium]
MIRKYYCAGILLFGFAIFLFISNIVQAQVSDKILSITAPPVSENESIKISAVISPAFVYDKIEVAYRSFGESEFKRIEMQITGNNAVAVIPNSATDTPYFEYFLFIHIPGTDQPETYPVENPTLHPLKLLITPVESHQNIIDWISPATDEAVTPDDLLIAFSVNNVSALKIFIDDKDFSEYLIKTEDLYIAKLENLPIELNEGKHNIRVELFDSNGKNIYSENRLFSIVLYKESIIKLSSLRYKASLQLESRNENINQKSNAYNRGSINATSDYGILKINGNLYATNEEKADRQPQNRYFIGAEIPWLRAGYGDNYPTFPNLIMNGKRIRGLSTNLTLGFFNFDFVYGDVARKISTKYNVLASPPDSTSDPNKTYFRLDDGRFAELIKRGEFDRNLFILRPSFGKGNNFLFGLSFLKSKDDMGSIKQGLMPQENLVVGSDLFFAFDQRRIEFNAQVAFSATNKDISKGTIKDEDIDSLLKSLTEEQRDMIRQAKDVLSNFITINEHIVPLALNNLTTLAYEGSLNLNYLNNSLKFTYLRRGSAYESFGQTYLRNDVQGFNITDRFRTLKNSLLFSFGFEKLSDNTDNSKPTTTRYSTLSGMVSFYPVIDFPNLSTGYTYSSAKNNFVNSIYWTDDFTHRIFVQLGYNFFYLARQNVSMSISTSNRNDQTSRDIDSKNKSLTFGLNTTYSIPLLSSFNISYNNSLILKNEINYTTISFTLFYKMFENRLQLNTSIRPTFGDIQRGAFDIGAQYLLVTNFNVIGQLSIFSNKHTKPESVFSLTLRYDI